MPDRFSIFLVEIVSLLENKVYPQIQKMVQGYDFDAPNSVYRLDRHFDKFPEFEPDLRFVLAKEAKPTNVLSSVFQSPMHGFIADESFVSVISAFHLPENAKYPCQVVCDEEIRGGYRWIHFVFDPSPYILWGESVWGEYDWDWDLVRTLKFNNRDDYFKAVKNLEEIENRIRPIKTIFNLNLLDFDLFKLRNGIIGTIVSKELKKELEENCISGINFKELVVERIDKSKGLLVW